MSDTDPVALRALCERTVTLHERLANANPKLSRGLVWCRQCGRCESVNAAECLRSGWPKSCGYTMTIDAPEESPGV